MQAFNQHHGIAAALLRSNIDTDSIIPSVEMKTVSRKGLSDGLFARWRYSDRVSRTPAADFILNQPVFSKTSILIGGENFGCGSSREHAVWALDEFGIRVIIAPSFGAIFRTNCISNGLLPIALPWPLVKAIASEVDIDQPEHELTIDLERRVITTPSGTQHQFRIPASDTAMLLNGWDAIALTMQTENKILEFEGRDKSQRPWVYLPDPEN
jgi:3-isopropylmalate/(R)-2-methylmalate dehydratase small subunit